VDVLGFSDSPKDPGLGKIEVSVKRLDPGLPLPKQAYPDDAGFDLYAASDCLIGPGERSLVPTGLAVAIPKGYAGLILPRSGLALRAGLSIVNSPGLIDSQYRGELNVIAVNLDDSSPIQIKRGDRIAQLLVLAVPQVLLNEVDELDSTKRGESGFGSSGL